MNTDGCNNVFEIGGTRVLPKENKVIEIEGVSANPYNSGNAQNTPFSIELTSDDIRTDKR